MPFITEKIKINASLADSSATVAGTGEKTVSPGLNTFEVTVTAENGSKKTYKIVVTRPDNRETINTLSAIKTSNGVLSPSFSKNVYSYKISLDPNVSSITITPTKEGTKSTFVSVRVINSPSLLLIYSLGIKPNVFLSCIVGIIPSLISKAHVNVCIYKLYKGSYLYSPSKYIGSPNGNLLSCKIAGYIEFISSTKPLPVVLPL